MTAKTISRSLGALPNKSLATGEPSIPIPPPGRLSAFAAELAVHAPLLCPRPVSQRAVFHQSSLAALSPLFPFPVACPLMSLRARTGDATSVNIRVERENRSSGFSSPSLHPMGRGRGEGIFSVLPTIIRTGYELSGQTSSTISAPCDFLRDVRAFLRVNVSFRCEIRREHHFSDHRPLPKSTFVPSPLKKIGGVPRTASPRSAVRETHHQFAQARLAAPRPAESASGPSVQKVGGGHRLARSSHRPRSRRLLDSSSAVRQPAPPFCRVYVLPCPSKKQGGGPPGSENCRQSGRPSIPSHRGTLCCPAESTFGPLHSKNGGGASSVSRKTAPGGQTQACWINMAQFQVKNSRTSGNRVSNPNSV